MFFIYIMLYTCAARFGVMKNLEKFLASEWTKQVVSKKIYKKNSDSPSHQIFPLLETRILLCVWKLTEKGEYTQKNIFLTAYRQKITHRNIMTEKSHFSVKKLCSPRLKFNLLCTYPHRKIILHTQKKEANCTGKTCIFLSI